jgi:hypothetical protein
MDSGRPAVRPGGLGFPADPLTGTRSAPHASTVRRLLQCVDSDALHAAIGAYLQARTPPLQLSEPPPKPSLRAMEVASKSNEIPSSQLLLETIPWRRPC